MHFDSLRQPAKPMAQTREMRLHDRVSLGKASTRDEKAVPILPLPLLGVVPLGYLTDLIYTRDMWMHRLDICRATRREMVQTGEHDGRITALVVRDLERRLTPRLAGQAVVYELTGLAGGSFRLGTHARPVARITMDVLDFHLLASGRMPADEFPSQVSLSGDEHIAHVTLNNTSVLY